MHLDLIKPTTHRAFELPKKSPKHKEKLKFAIPSTEIAVRKGLLDIIAALRALDLSFEEYGSIELVLAEVMNNIVEHAYADAPDGVIKLVIQPKERGLYCTFSDDGQPMPDGAAPLGNLATLNCELDDLPEGGFGWFLIRDLARDLEYSRKSGKNILTFRMAVVLPHLPAS